MSSTPKLRLAVIGCGFFAQNHLNAWAEIPEVELVAVCDAIESKAIAAAGRFGGRAYTDAARMLADESIDFVDVVTNVADHRAMVELVARQGKHVICQKPMADNYEDARAMVEACAAAGITFMVHENFRWQAPLREVKRLVDSGEIGRLFFGRAWFRSNFNLYDGQPYLAEQKRFLIQDVGVHMLDVGRFFFGEPRHMAAHAVRVNPAVKGEDTFTLMLAMDNATCILDASYCTQTEHEVFPQVLLTLEGDRGVINLREDFRLEIVHNGGMQVRTVQPPSHVWSRAPWTVVHDSVYNINRHFVECLKSGRQPETSGADNLKVMELTYGAYQALETQSLFQPAQR